MTLNKKKLFKKLNKKSKKLVNNLFFYACKNPPKPLKPPKKLQMQNIKIKNLDQTRSKAFFKYADPNQTYAFIIYQNFKKSAFAKFIK